MSDRLGCSKFAKLLSTPGTSTCLRSGSSSPKARKQFKGGSIWGVIVNIHDAVRAIGLALLVLFFVVGVMRTCGSFAEVKKPEHALKLFIRFAIAKGVVTLWAGADDGPL